MADRAAHIELAATGAGGRIVVDGHDVSALVCGLRLVAQVHKRPQLELDLALRQAVVAAADGDVVVSPQTAEDLQALGWTLPLDVERLRDQRDALVRLLNEVLAQFVHPGHPGQACKRSGWVSEARLAGWHEAVQQTALIDRAVPG